MISRSRQLGAVVFLFCGLFLFGEVCHAQQTDSLRSGSGTLSAARAAPRARVDSFPRFIVSLRSTGSTNPFYRDPPGSEIEGWEKTNLGWGVSAQYDVNPKWGLSVALERLERGFDFAVGFAIDPETGTQSQVVGLVTQSETSLMLGVVRTLSNGLLVPRWAASAGLGLSSAERSLYYFTQFGVRRTIEQADSARMAALAESSLGAGLRLSMFLIGLDLGVRVEHSSSLEYTHAIPIARASLALVLN